MKIVLTEPQVFWLKILLKSILACADKSKAIKSYEAILRKLEEPEP